MTHCLKYKQVGKILRLFNMASIMEGRKYNNKTTGKLHAAQGEQTNKCNMQGTKQTVHAHSDTAKVQYKCQKSTLWTKTMHCLIVWCVGSFLSVAAQHRWQAIRPSYMYKICRQHTFKSSMYILQHSMRGTAPTACQLYAIETPAHANQSINQASSRHDPLWPSTNHFATVTIVPRAHQHTDSCSQNTATQYHMIEYWAHTAWQHRTTWLKVRQHDIK